jgi:hypothetical protein
MVWSLDVFLYPGSRLLKTDGETQLQCRIGNQPSLSALSLVTVSKQEYDSFAFQLTSRDCFTEKAQCGNALAAPGRVREWW